MSIKAKYTRSELLNALRGKPAPYITFTKVNGEERRMWCSLNETYIPDSAKPGKEKSDKKSEEKKKTRKANDNIICVFDLDKQEWRSFRVDSVTKYDYIVS